MYKIVFFLLLSFSGFAQNVINYIEPKEGIIKLSEDIEIPKVDAGYTLWLPEVEPLGAIVFFHSERDTVSKSPIIPLALAQNLSILFVTTENSLEFLFEVEQMQKLERYIHQACQRHNIPKNNLLFSGMSLEGTRALKMAVFSKSKDAKYRIIPKAVAMCDAPLDMVRFWAEANKAWRMNLNDLAASEGQWVSQYLAENLGGKPEGVLPNYINYSPYCHIAENGGNARYLTDIAIRAYTEPDVIWWMEERGKDYYGMNATDAAALINQLKIDENKAVELILTENKGYRPDGSRHPHSWSIVNEQELIDWFLGL